ncbi:MAG: chromosomal replication initiator protein DnaA [Planctomycetota bacterium]
MNDGERDRLWGLLVGEIRRRVTGPQFETWFSRASIASDDGTALEIAVPSRLIKDWLEDRYVSIVEEAAATIRPGTRVSFVVSRASPAVAPPASAPAADPAPAFAPSARAPRIEQNPESGFSLNPEYVFDNFVVGPCNELAHAAARAVADAPARAYNPLFLHGSVGLGKTHLLQAIAHGILRSHPDARILYFSCETFTNHFVSAIAKGEIDRFRSRYRNVDVLLIDDIQFLANKDRTQTEFFHTFNALHGNQKQIVLTSDSPPKEIPSLEERLVSRFKWGMVAELGKPTLEDRIAILKRKARLREIEIPDAALLLIAQRVDSNVRELEGTLIKVTAMANLRRKAVDASIAAEVLREGAPERFRVRVEDIQDALSVRFQIRLSDLQSKRRPRSIVLPRQIGMHLARVLTEHSLAEIGGYFGGRDHTTVLYADAQIRSRMRLDESLRSIVDSLTSEILSKKP